MYAEFSTLDNLLKFAASETRDEDTRRRALSILEQLPAAISEAPYQFTTVTGKRIEYTGEEKDVDVLSRIIFHFFPDMFDPPENLGGVGFYRYWNKEDVTYHAIFEPTSHIIYIPIIIPLDRSEFSNLDENEDETRKMAEYMRELLISLINSRKILIFHEIIHYLDNERVSMVYSISKLLDEQISDKNPTTFEEDYYNRPDETNAYYQMLVQHVIESLNEDPSLRRELMGDPHAGFERILLTMKLYDPNVFENLSSKNEKHFLKRLYNFYMSLREQFINDNRLSTSEQSEYSVE